MESLHIAAWLTIGAIVGFIATKMRPATDRINFIESMAVAIFGSFIGGEALATLFGAASRTSLTMPALALAAGCALGALVLLGMMRKVVGPLRSRTKRRR